jgi:hypothetical protein
VTATHIDLISSSVLSKVGRSFQLTCGMVAH